MVLYKSIILFGFHLFHLFLAPFSPSFLAFSWTEHFLYFHFISTIGLLAILLCFSFVATVLAQESAKCCLWAKSDLPSVFVNSLVERSHIPWHHYQGKYPSEDPTPCSLYWKVVALWLPGAWNSPALACSFFSSCPTGVRWSPHVYMQISSSTRLEKTPLQISSTSGFCFSNFTLVISNSHLSPQLDETAWVLPPWAMD